MWGGCYLKGTDGASIQIDNNCFNHNYSITGVDKRTIDTKAVPAHSKVVGVPAGIYN